MTRLYFLEFCHNMSCFFVFLKRPPFLGTPFQCKKGSAAIAPEPFFLCISLFYALQDLAQRRFMRARNPMRIATARGKTMNQFWISPARRNPMKETAATVIA